MPRRLLILGNFQPDQVLGCDPLIDPRPGPYTVISSAPFPTLPQYQHTARKMARDDPFEEAMPGGNDNLGLQGDGCTKGEQRYKQLLHDNLQRQLQLNGGQLVKPGMGVKYIILPIRKAFPSTEPPLQLPSSSPFAGPI